MIKSAAMCKWCDGTGKVDVAATFRSGKLELPCAGTVPCAHCHGDGFVCDLCFGAGVLRECCLVGETHRTGEPVGEADCCRIFVEVACRRCTVP